MLLNCPHCPFEVDSHLKDHGGWFMFKKHTRTAHAKRRKSTNFYRRLRRMRTYLAHKIVPLRKEVAA